MTGLDISHGFSKSSNIESAVREASIQIRDKLAHPHINVCIVLFNFSLSKINNLPYVVKRILNPDAMIGFYLPLLLYEEEVFKRGVVIITFSGKDVITGVSSKYGDILNLSERFIWKIVKDAGNKKKSCFISFSEFRYSEPSYFLKSLDRRLGRNTPFTGVFSCREIAPSAIIYNEKVLNDCSVGLLLLENIKSFVEVKSGFNPLGKGGSITSYKKNIIKEIDNKPAIDFYRRYFGDKITQKEGYYNTVVNRYPLGFKIPGYSEYILAKPVKIRNDGSLVLIKDVISPDLKLMISTRKLLIDVFREGCGNLKSSMKNPKIGIVFDSFYRYKLLGVSYSEQLAAAKESLGDIPLVGGISFYNMGTVSLPKVHLGHFIWENSYSLLGLGE